MKPCFLLALVAFATPSSPSRRTTTVIDPFTRIEAESYDYATSVSDNICQSSSCGTYVGNLNNGDTIAYYSVDFQEGATRIQVSVAADATKYDYIGIIHLHLDNVTSNPFTSVVMGDTGGLEAFVVATQFIEFPPFGLHDLYLVFATTFGGKDIGNVDWFQFYKVPDVDGWSRSGLQTIDAFATIPAEDWSYQAGIVESECMDKSVCDNYTGYINAGDVIGYSALDFGVGATGLRMALAANAVNGDQIGTIQLRLDNRTSVPFASVVTGNTAGEQKWVEICQFIEYPPSQVHDLYLTFTCDSGSADIGNIAWLQFFKVN